jgi:hypothetical protein
MEYTAVLAGERFSDSPKCTDPVLAALARAVNDVTGDASRQRLAVLASELTTANGGDAAARHAVVRRCLLTALPYADGERRQALIVGLLGLERAAARRCRGWRPDLMCAEVELALLPYDTEVAAAQEFVGSLPVGKREHARRALPASVELAVATIAERADGADELLYRLLVECLDDYRSRPDSSADDRAASTVRA